MKQFKAKIIKNERIASQFYKMALAAPYLAKASKPGQFVEVRCSDGTDPLLRRPLGVHRITKGGIELLYEVVGKGTGLLSGMRQGASLDVIGPLGNGFTLNKRASEQTNQRTILVAGGNGVAPLLGLAEALVRKFDSSMVHRPAYIMILIGGRNKCHVLCEKEFKNLGFDVKIATDDGSKGYKGLVTDLLKKELSNKRTSELTNQRTIYACGPTGMLKTVAKLAKAAHIPCQVSLEERMACGVGVCLGCPVKVRKFASSQIRKSKPTNQRTNEPTNYIYKMVCKDGPVFNSEEIAWG